MDVVHAASVASLKFDAASVAILKFDAVHAWSVESVKFHIKKSEAGDRLV